MKEGVGHPYLLAMLPALLRNTQPVEIPVCSKYLLQTFLAHFNKSIHGCVGNEQTAPQKKTLG